MINMSKHEKYVLSLIGQNFLMLVVLLAFMIGIWLMFISVISFINEEAESLESPIIDEEPIEQQLLIEYKAIKEADPITTSDIKMIAKDKIDAKMLELEYEEVNREQWYAEYKQILDFYDGYVDAPETVYDVFTSDEIYLIQRAVETEVFQCSFDAKVNVASVIFNRIEDGRFGNTVHEIITRPGQFAWHRTKISESTILAVEYAYEIGDTTDGCIAFRSDRKPEKWGKWVYRFSDSAVHHFYSEED